MRNKHLCCSPGEKQNSPDALVVFIMGLTQNCVLHTRTALLMDVILFQDNKHCKQSNTATALSLCAIPSKSPE